ncbi:MAG: DEAD/DEAH box helicase [Acholeplasmatales bacterium]|nr:DEAD/DEAH box helicase [Acholeplasmatales bacterium]
MIFDGFELKEEIVNALNDLHFKSFSPIQKEILPLALKNKSLIGQSKTGSGKTHAFLIPIFNKLDLDNQDCQAIILSPTRELATQIYNVCLHLNKFFDDKIDIRLYTGGSDRLKEIKKLENSQPQIVIGTPGRISDLMIKANALKGFNANTLVVDEADMAFEIGFLDDIDLIAGRLTNPQIMVFSATIKEEIKPFIRKYINTNDHIKVDLELNKIKHVLIPIKSRDKFMLLSWLINNINPYLCLIFGNKKQDCEAIASFLLDNNIKVGILHGGLSARERKRVLNDINDLKYQYVVVSDIAARGIDILGVSHVINFSLPTDFEFYIHRSGRTARNNSDGICYSFTEFKNEEYLKSLEEKGIKFSYCDIRPNGFIEYNPNRRTDRVKPISEERKKAEKLVPKSKKVTPGYKKKRLKEVKKLEREMKYKRPRNK